MTCLEGRDREAMKGRGVSGGAWSGRSMTLARPKGVASKRTAGWCWATVQNGCGPFRDSWGAARCRPPPHLASLPRRLHCQRLADSYGRMLSLGPRQRGLRVLVRQEWERSLEGSWVTRDFSVAEQKPLGPSLLSL